ncbi:MAG: hypothetical protein II938_01840 [Alphaproteobacteria bacterium]|nr:hypothetical protein [Alphaproteobacteria bacterium]
MRIVYKFLIMLMVLGIGGYVWAVVPHAEVQINPQSMSDSIRGAIGNIMALLPAADGPQMGANINVTQGKADALVTGDASYVVDEGTGAPSNSDLNISAYEYVKENILDNDKKTAYGPLNDKIKSGGDMTAVVKEMFFIENEEDNTEENKTKIMENRKAYLKTIASDYVYTAYNVREKLIDDMKAISADLNGNGTIGATSGIDQSWRAVNKALIADIAMQIQMLELDAARFLSVQPIVLMPKDRPAVENDG